MIFPHLTFSLKNKHPVNSINIFQFYFCLSSHLQDLIFQWAAVAGYSFPLHWVQLCKLEKAKWRCSCRFLCHDVKINRTVICMLPFKDNIMSLARDDSALITPIIFNPPPTPWVHMIIHYVNNATPQHWLKIRIETAYLLLDSMSIPKSTFLKRDFWPS